MKNRNLSNISAGIIDGLESMNNMSDELKENVEHKSKRVKEQNSNGVEEEKSKRSFMLKHKQISMIYELKQLYVNKDLSQIVGEAIEEYYKNNKIVKE